MFLDVDIACTWCGTNMSCNHLTGMNEVIDRCHFCDYACAKLYHDKIRKVVIDYDSYNELYMDGKLKNTARKMFEIVKRSGFYILPTIYRDVNIDTPADRKALSSEYRALLCL